MADYNPNVVSASSTGPKLPDGVVDIESIETSDPVLGCRVFTHYNGPTDQLSGLDGRRRDQPNGSREHPLLAGPAEDGHTPLGPRARSVHSSSSLAASSSGDR